MPDLVTHVWFAAEAVASLPPEIRERVDDRLCAYASAGPDVWFPCGFYGGPDKALAPRGGYMHENDTGAFLTALVRRCRESEATDGLFSYLSGYLCHYCLDTAAHPYIIYRTGNYDQTPETLRYRGNHTRLERAIDVHVIREKYGSDTRRFHLVRRCLPLKKLPESLKEDLDQVYRQIYGWEEVWAALNRAIRDHRLLYWLLRDTTGVLNRLTPLFDNGVSVYDYRYFSYQGRDLDGSGVDYLNLRHTPWRNFADPSLVSSESFPDLVERARGEAVELISIIYNYVYQKAGDLPVIARRIGNASYTSGLDCRDGRNRAPGVFDPLF